MPTLDPTIFDLYAEADSLSGGTGTSVTSFTDLSGNNRHLAASSNQPNIESAAVGGKKSVTFTGSNSPLVWNGSLEIITGWMVVKVNQFTNYNGVLSSPQHIAILEGRLNEPYFFNNLYDYFEYRLDDRIYPPSSMSAPVGEFGLVYFRAWKSLTVEGVQIGQDRNLADRRLNGSIALVALSSKGFCEDDVQKYTKAIAVEYDIPIAPVFPFSASKADTGSYKPTILVGGGAQRTKEIKRGVRATFDTSYESRSNLEWDEAFDFYNRYLAKTFLFRNYNHIPPKDTIVEFTDESEFEDRGNIGIRRNYALQFVESVIPPLYAIPGQPPVLPPSLIVPAKPTLTADNALDTLEANHALGKTEILVSVNNQPYVPYASVADASGIIRVGNVARAAGYYKFKVKAANGRLESAVAPSPVFTLAAGANQQPVASNLSMSGTRTVGQILTANFAYSDPESDPPGVHLYKWFRSDTNTGAGTNVIEIDGATGKTYTLTPADAGKYISFSVVPVATKGELLGSETFSLWTTAAIAKFTPPAPTINPTTTSDANNTAGWNYVAGFTAPQDYEHSFSTGASGSWAISQSNPIDVGNAAYADKQVQVRLRGNDALGRNPSAALEFPPFTASGGGNAKPGASNVRIIGTPIVGVEVEGAYTYTDGDTPPDGEGATTFKWYRADNATGTVNKVVISGATAKKYTVQSADDLRYIAFAVTPVALTGTLTGDETLSVWTLVGSSVPPGPTPNGTGKILWDEATQKELYDEATQKLMVDSY